MVIQTRPKPKGESYLGSSFDSLIYVRDENCPSYDFMQGSFDVSSRDHLALKDLEGKLDVQERAGSLLTRERYLGGKRAPREGLSSPPSL